MKKTWLLAGLVAASVGFGAPAFAQQPTIPVIVKDTTSFYWQIVLAGARKAGKDLGVNVPELGAQSESDINGQICDPRERRLRQARRHRDLADRSSRRSASRSTRPPSRSRSSASTPPPTPRPSPRS